MRATRASCSRRVVAVAGRRGRPGAGVPPAEGRTRRRRRRRGGRADRRTARRCRTCAQGRRSRSPATVRDEAAPADDPGLTEVGPEADRAPRPPAPPSSGSRRDSRSRRRPRALGNGVAVPPLEAPEAVKQIIEAGNMIARTPVHLGRRPRQVARQGLRLLGLGVVRARLRRPAERRRWTSGPLMGWGEPGPGKWVTIYANTGHVYMYVAGIRFDTSRSARHRVALEQHGALHRGLRRPPSRRSVSGLGSPPHEGS